MKSVYRHNEALNTWQLVGKDVTDEYIANYTKTLTQSSVLDRTRSFVAWVVVEAGQPNREIARGMAR